MHLTEIVREVESVTSLAGVGVRASIAGVEALRGIVALEDILKIYVVTPIVDICRIGIKTYLVGGEGLGVRTSVADVLRMVNEIPRAGIGIGTLFVDK